MRKLFIASAVLFLSTSALAAETMFCQFWNSVTHSPQAGTISGEFAPGQAAIGKFFTQDISANSNEKLAFKMEFSRANTSLNKAEKFVAELYLITSEGSTVTLNRYERNLPGQKLENFVITAAYGNTYYVSALCSPQ